MKTNTTTLEPNSIRPAHRASVAKIHYTDLTRGAALYNIRSAVLLETRVLEEFAELDPIDEKCFGLLGKVTIKPAKIPATSLAERIG